MIHLILTAFLSQSAPAPSAPVVPTPSVVGLDPSQPVLVEYDLQAIQCGGAAIAPVTRVQPNVATAYSRPAALGPYTIRFRIDASGRPVTIGVPTSSEKWDTGSSDLVPALAAMRFPAGAAREGCEVTVTARTIPIDVAPIALLHRAYALPHERGFGDAAMQKRLSAAYASCRTPKAPGVLNRAFPDFDRIPQAPSTSSYAVVGFDIDDGGKPARARILSSDGNAALDAAAVQAVRDSRFSGGGTGCSYPYYRRQSAAVAPPPMPDLDAYRAADAHCDKDTAWELPPRMSYPEPFRRRAIEGWAIIGYDVAPWGQTGNLKVLASEPAAAFGTAAESIVRQARQKPSAQGASGCVDRVVFKLPAGGAQGAVADAATVE